MAKPDQRPYRRYNFSAVFDNGVSYTVEIQGPAPIAVIKHVIAILGLANGSRLRLRLKTRPTIMGMVPQLISGLSASTRAGKSPDKQQEGRRLCDVFW